MLAFLFSGYKWKSAGYGFVHRPSRKMTLSMVDAFLIGFVLVHGPSACPPPPRARYPPGTGGPS